MSTMEHSPKPFNRRIRGRQRMKVTMAKGRVNRPKVNRNKMKGKEGSNSLKGLRKLQLVLPPLLEFLDK